VRVKRDAEDLINYAQEQDEIHICKGLAGRHDGRLPNVIR
jgi:hypothetical protein